MGFDKYSAEPLECGTVYGYAFDKDGFHHGRSLPKRSLREVMEWIAIQVVRSNVHELRVVDIGDNMIMQVIGQSLVFPEVGRNLWNPAASAFQSSGVGVALAAQITGTLIPDNVLRGGRFEKCINCGQPFTHANVHTQLGWRETQISGCCEDCFDA